MWNGKINKTFRAQLGDKIIGEENKATSLLRDLLNESFDNVVIDDKPMFNEIRAYVKKFEPKRKKKRKSKNKNNLDEVLQDDIKSEDSTD